MLSDVLEECTAPVLSVQVMEVETVDGGLTTLRIGTFWKISAP
jgi:hypothetical protein